MPGIVLVSPEPLAGKTTVAAGLARKIAAAGRNISLQRIPGDEHAQSDATLFSGLKGVSQDPNTAEISLIEAPAGEAISSLAAFPDGRALVIADASIPMDALADYCRQVGGRLGGAVINKTPARRVEALRDDARAAGVDLLATLPEDRLLAAPVLRDVVQALSAQT